jgi:hypothetical protein
LSPWLAIFSWDSQKFSNFRFLQWWNSPQFSEMSSGLVKINCYKYPSAKNLYSKPESCVNKFKWGKSWQILSCLMQMTISIPNHNNQSQRIQMRNNFKICQEFVHNKIIVMMIGTCPLWYTPVTEILFQVMYSLVLNYD